VFLSIGEKNNPLLSLLSMIAFFLDDTTLCLGIVCEVQADPEVVLRVLCVLQLSPLEVDEYHRQQVPGAPKKHSSDKCCRSHSDPRFVFMG
jgi:hypothetical protein